MSIDKGKQSARWKRNKAAERARKEDYPKILSEDFTARVLGERNRRAAVREFADYVIRPGYHFFEPGTFERAIQFAADVWAADTWLTAEWGPKGAMPRRVADWLDAHAAPHGYTDKSLPKMVRRARIRIALLEQPLPLNSDRPLWEPFDPTLENDDPIAPTHFPPDGHLVRT